jgi:hypothetical protein
MACSGGALGVREGWCGVERSGGSERRRLGRGCFYRPARSDGGAWAVASANWRARADVRGALEGDVGGAGINRVGRRCGKEGGVEREMFPERVCVLLRV